MTKRFSTRVFLICFYVLLIGGLLVPSVLKAEDLLSRGSRNVNAQYPEGNNYWKFVDWYRNHAVLSVIVSGTNCAHVADVFQKLDVLKMKQNILIGDILVVSDECIQEIVQRGKSKNVRELESAFAKSKDARVVAQVLKWWREPTPLGDISERLELNDAREVDASLALRRLEVKYSPTWIIRYHGQDFVYEGVRDPAKLFDASGRFVGDES